MTEVIKVYIPHQNDVVHVLLLLLFLFFCYFPGALKLQFSQGQPQWCSDERKPKLDGVDECQLPIKKIEEEFNLPGSEITVRRRFPALEEYF